VVPKISSNFVITDNKLEQLRELVVRTGGSSLIPMVENMLVDIFGQDRVVEFNPFTSVAGGLSI
jgi:molecular chaperone DnaK (HSP70)